MGTPNIEIERKIPAPTSSGGRPAKYPFTKMKVGDSFVVHDQDPTAGTRVRSAATGFSRRNPAFKFTVRQEDDGFRVWRIAK